MATKHEEIRIATLDIGEGAINPADRVAAGEITDDDINEFVSALDDPEYYVSIDENAIPTQCVDGRCERGGTKTFGANAAGGTFSLVMADALTNDSYRREDENAPQHAARLYAALAEKGHEIGSHSDMRADGENSGCGAQDKLDAPNGQPSILEYITRRGEDVRVVTESFGVEVSDELHDHIVGKAQQLRSDRYATNGAELSQVCRDKGGRVAVLEGDHFEVALKKQEERGKTLNRDKLHEKYGARLAAFNLDIFGLENGTKAISTSEAEAQSKFIAALYYNVATAAVLAGPSLRV